MASISLWLQTSRGRSFLQCNLFKQRCFSLKKKTFSSFFSSKCWFDWCYFPSVGWLLLEAPSRCFFPKTTRLSATVWTSVLSYLFGGVLLLGGVGPSQLVLHAVSVLQLFHLINPDQPVLRRKGLLQVLQLNVLVADLSVACPVEARRCPEVQLGGEFRSL